MKNDWIKKDRADYERKKEEIHAALAGKTGMINGVIQENRQAIFYELCFCICVPQSRAKLAQEFINDLKANDFYHRSLSPDDLIVLMNGRVRFHTTKAHRLDLVKYTFSHNIWSFLKDSYQKYDTNPTFAIASTVRDILHDKVNGVGMKLSSQFMRNVGFRKGDAGLAILDVHILRHLAERKLIPEFKQNLTKSEYCDIENVMKKYTHQVGISIEELDLLWWSNKTGFVLK